MEVNKDKLQVVAQGSSSSLEAQVKLEQARVKRVPVPRRLAEVDLPVEVQCLTTILITSSTQGLSMTLTPPTLAWVPPVVDQHLPLPTEWG